MYDQNDSGDSQVRQVEQEVVKAKNFVVPNSKNKLFACQRCRLIKSEEQWRGALKCQNCREFRNESNYKQYITNKFQGMVTIIDSNRSWLRRKLFLGKNAVSGVYAVNLI